MIDPFKTGALSAAALIAGMVCVVGLWSLVPREGVEIVENRSRFDGLSGQEQADLRNKATAFVDPALGPELVRLQRIHAAVEKNPALLTRLESLDKLLSDLDPETKAKLKPNGEFADDWVDQVTKLASGKNVGDEKFEFPPDALVHWRFHGPPVVVSGTDYEAFLDQIADRNWGDNQEYLKYIQGDDVAMRRMFKTLALIDRSIENKSPGLNASIVKDAREALIPAGTERNDKIRKAILQFKEHGERQPVEQRTIATSFSALKILEVGLRNTERTFLAQETVTPEVFTKNLTRSEQVALMTMAPDDAVQELKAKLVADSSSENPQVVRVNEILKETRERVKGRSWALFGELSQLKGFGNRSYFGGARGSRRGRDDGGRGERGPGGRSSSGRGPDGPGAESKGRPDFDRRRGVGGKPGTGSDTEGSGQNGPDSDRQAVDKERSGKPSRPKTTAANLETAAQTPAASNDGFE